MEDVTEASRLTHLKNEATEELKAKFTTKASFLHSVLLASGLTKASVQMPKTRDKLVLDVDGLFIIAGMKNEIRILSRFNDEEVWPENARDSKSRIDFVNAALLLPMLKNVIFEKLEEMVRETKAAIEALDDIG